MTKLYKIYEDQDKEWTLKELKLQKLHHLDINWLLTYPGMTKVLLLTFLSSQIQSLKGKTKPG